MLDVETLRTTLSEMNQPMLSLYLHVDNARQENQSENPAWRIELKNALRDANEDVMQADAREMWEAAEEHLNSFFDSYQPQGRSLVIFTDGAAFEQFELPIPLKSQAHLGEPLTIPLLWALDEYERYLIVQVDSENARFISAYLGVADNADEMQLEIDDYDFREKRMMPALNSTQAVGGLDQDAYDSMIESHVTRFYNDVIERIHLHKSEMGVRRVIISGDEKSAHKLHDQMNDGERKDVVGLAPAPMSSSETEVMDRVLDTALAYERSYETELVEQLINDAKAGGRGALGADEVIEALIQSRVDLLVLPYPPTENDIANDLKQRAFENGVEIELVHGAPAAKLEHEGGVAARLYYTLSEQA